jgi:hypothetical protein
MNLCGGQRQRPFLLIGDALGVTVSESQQAFGLRSRCTAWPRTTDRIRRVPL